MEQAEAKLFQNRRIRLVLKSGYRYTGEIINVTENSLFLKDKFSKEVFIDLKNIAVCEDVGNE